MKQRMYCKTTGKAMDKNQVFESFYSENYEKLLGIAKRYCEGNVDRAYDILGRASAKIFKNFDPERENRDFMALFKTSMRNLVMDENDKMKDKETGEFYKIRSEDQLLSLDENYEAYNFSERNADSVEDTVLDKCEAQEQRKKLLDYINADKSFTMLCVKLVYFDGMSYQEAADYLGSNKDTVKSAVNRGVKKLTKIFGPKKAA